MFPLPWPLPLSLLRRTPIPLVFFFVSVEAQLSLMNLGHCRAASFLQARGVSPDGDSGGKLYLVMTLQKIHLEYGCLQMT